MWRSRSNPTNSLRRSRVSLGTPGPRDLPMQLRVAYAPSRGRTTSVQTHQNDWDRNVASNDLRERSRGESSLPTKPSGPLQLFGDPMVFRQVPACRRHGVSRVEGRVEYRPRDLWLGRLELVQ